MYMWENGEMSILGKWFNNLRVNAPKKSKGKPLWLYTRLFAVVFWFGRMSYGNGIREGASGGP